MGKPGLCLLYRLYYQSGKPTSFVLLRGEYALFLYRLSNGIGAAAGHFCLAKIKIKEVTKAYILNW